MKPVLTAFLRCCTLALGTGLVTALSVQTARAEGVVITLDNVSSFESDADVVPANNTSPEQSALNLHLRSAFTLGYRQKLDNGHILSFGQTVEGDVVPGIDTLDRLEFKTTGQYQMDLDEARKWQLRVQGEYTHNKSREMLVFDRVRAGVQLRFRHGPQHLSRARLRLGYRDQNDAKFQGFDQTEILLEVGHDWRPGKDRRNLSVTAYSELRRAEASKFSYDEFGLRLAYRHPVSKTFELTGRVSGFVRDYDGAFSATDPSRHDTRLLVQVDGAYKLSDRASLVGYVGWEANRSNINARDYAGPVAGVQLKINLGRWTR